MTIFPGPVLPGKAAFAEAARGYGLAKELVVAAAAASAEAVMVMPDSEFCMRLLSCGAPPPPPPPPAGPLGAAALAVAEVDMGMSPPSEEAPGGRCASVAAPVGTNSIEIQGSAPGCVNAAG